MELINTKVRHQDYGEGTIIRLENSYIYVNFKQCEMKFQYPNSFDEFLVHENSNIHAIIKKDIEILKKSQIYKKQKPVENKKKNNADKRKIVKIKFYPRTNIAFKCNFCDGGHSNNRVGFNGVCSNGIIRNNIEVEKRVWCNEDDSPCSQYLNGIINRSELDDMCNDGGSVCYESQMLRDWKAFAGVVHTGKRKGKPMKLNQVQNNSLCILTTRDPNSNESERYIFGAFLVDENNKGDNENAGYVMAKSRYRIELTPKEARKMLFWNYHSNNNQPTVAVWSSGLHRYVKDDEAIQILNDIAKLKQKTKEQELANDFLNYFAQISDINLSIMPEKNGALQRK